MRHVRIGSSMFTVAEARHGWQRGRRKACSQEARRFTQVIGYGMRLTVHARGVPSARDRVLKSPTHGNVCFQKRKQTCGVYFIRSGIVDVSLIRERDCRGRSARWPILELAAPSRRVDVGVFLCRRLWCTSTPAAAGCPDDDAEPRACTGDDVSRRWVQACPLERYAIMQRSIHTFAPRTRIEMAHWSTPPHRIIVSREAAAALASHPVPFFLVGALKRADSAPPASRSLDPQRRASFNPPARPLLRPCPGLTLNGGTETLHPSTAPTAPTGRGFSTSAFLSHHLNLSHPPSLRANAYTTHNTIATRDLPTARLCLSLSASPCSAARRASLSPSFSPPGTTAHAHAHAHAPCLATPARRFRDNHRHPSYLSLAQGPELLSTRRVDHLTCLRIAEDES